MMILVGVSSYILLSAVSLQVYADFSCDFGKRSQYSKSGLTDCGMVQSTSPRAWGVVSGWGSQGRDVSRGKNGGFFITQPDQSPATFSLPDFSLDENSGTLSFYYKFFGDRSRLIIKTCGNENSESTLTLRGVQGGWNLKDNVRIFCNHRAPSISFTAEWSQTSGRIAVDNVTVVSSPPPTTAETTTTQREISTSVMSSTTWHSSLRTSNDNANPGATSNTTKTEQTIDTSTRRTHVSTSTWQARTMSSTEGPKSGGAFSTITVTIVIVLLLTVLLISIFLYIKRSRKSQGGGKDSATAIGKGPTQGTSGEDFVNSTYDLTCPSTGYGNSSPQDSKVQDMYTDVRKVPYTVEATITYDNIDKGCEIHPKSPIEGASQTKLADSASGQESEYTYVDTEKVQTRVFTGVRQLRAEEVSSDYRDVDIATGRNHGLTYPQESGTVDNVLYVPYDS